MRASPTRSAYSVQRPSPDHRLGRGARAETITAWAVARGVLTGRQTLVVWFPTGHPRPALADAAARLLQEELAGQPRLQLRENPNKLRCARLTL